MKIKNYGEVLAAGLGMDLLAYDTYGSYQGDYIAVLKKEDKVFIFKGSYGSCSGCDWLERALDWATDEVSEDDIKAYCEGEKPFLVIPSEKLEVVVKASRIEEFFPANTRNDYDDWDWEDIRKLMIQAATPEARIGK